MATKAPYGRDTTNQFRPFEYGKKQRRYDEMEDPDAYSGIIDSYRDSYLGAIGNFFERQAAGGTAPKGWDPLDHIPKGYEKFTSSFMNVTSPQMMNVVTQQIDERLALGARREKRGIVSTIGSDLVAGLIDPSNLIVGPALKGAGFLAGTAKGALFNGVMGAGQEAVVWGLEPGLTPEEGRARVLGGAIGGAGLGAVIGGVVGGVTSRAAGAAASPVARQLSRNQIVNFVLHQLEGGDKLVDNQDGAGLTKYGLTDKYNPELGGVAKITLDQARAHAQSKYWRPEFDHVDPRIGAIAFDAHYINSITTAHQILKADSVEEALRIYRDKLMWIADNVKGKARYRRGWNNRIDKLAKFVGGGNSSPIIAGARQPKGINLDDRGYLKIKRGHTGIYDDDGNYIPAAVTRRRNAPMDDHTLVPVEERTGKYETLERQTSQQQDHIGKRKLFELDVPETPTTINRPRVKVNPPEEPPSPRVVNDDVDAAIELDRLERGDAEAARITVGNKASDLPKAFGDMGRFIGEGLRKRLYDQYLKGSTKESDSFTNESPLLKAAKNETFLDFEHFSSWATDFTKQNAKNLPFALEQAAKKLPEKDAKFLTDVLELKGLASMSRKELDQLGHIVSKLPDINPEAAKMWMGKGYEGGAITPYEAVERIDALVMRRKELQGMAPQYERDVAPFDLDTVRDKLDLAMDEAVYNLDKATDDLETIRLEKKAKVMEQVADLDPQMPGRKEAIVAIKKAWNAEYDNAINLARERRWRIQERMKEISAERAEHFGMGKEVGGNEAYWGKHLGGGDSPEKVLTEGDQGILWNKQTGERIEGGQFGRLTGEAAPKKMQGEPPEDLKEIWAEDKRKQELSEYSSSELSNMIQEKQSELLDMERGQERWINREKVQVPFSTKKAKRKPGQKNHPMSQQELYDLRTRQMNDMINRLHEVRSFEAEMDDYLPFRLPKRDQPNTAEHLDDPDGEYIAIDVDALLASFPDKPWTQSVHGLPGMAEDAFRTPEEWVNFVFLHEREHVQNPRMEGEVIGDYEKRINDRALAALDSEDAPWKPIDGWKERLVLAPTPIGHLMRLVTNPNNYIWKAIQVIGGDYDLRLQRNLVEGGSSQAGGSVFQKTMRHTARAAEFFHASSNHYIEYVTGKQSDWGSVGVAYSAWRASKKAAGMNKLTWQEFDKAVGQVQISGKASGVKQIDASAALFNEIVEDVRRQAEELGILPGRENAEMEAKALRSAINSLEHIKNRGPKGDAMLAKMYEDFERVSAKALRPAQTPGKKGLPYFTRVWNPKALLDNPDEIKRIFREAYQREGDSVQDAAAAAEKTYQKLIEDPTSQSIEVASTAGEFRSREIPVENDEVMAFIHQDASIILARYMRHTGGAIEMTRAFGDAAGLLEENRIYAALEADGMKEGEIQAALQIWQDVRDRVIGGFHGENPMSTSNRLVRFAKKWTSTAVMGMSGVSQITDLARAMWVTGPNSFAKGLFAPMFQQFAGFDPGGYAKSVGESLEIEMGLMSRRMMDDDDWTMRLSETGIEKLMGDLEVPFFILNGLSPFTNLVKRGVARAVPHITIDRARRVTEAIHAGKVPNPEDATWLREMGIDEHDAQLLTKMPVTETKGGFIMADLDQWAALGDEGLRAKDLLMGVVSGHTRRAVSTPGPLNRPRIMDGILINKKDRAKGWADRWAAEQAENDARSYVKSLRREGFHEGDPDFDKAVKDLIQAAGVHKRAQLNTGSKGRKESPVLSLPFQLQSFALAQSAKLTHSVLSGRDKNVLFGLAGMWGAGIMVSWLKGEIAGTNDNATLDEHIMRGFSNSGVLSWLGIPLQAAMGLTSMAVGEVNLGPINVVTGDRPGITDQTSFLGPATNVGIGTLEALYGTGFDGKDLAPSERVYQLRKVLPFGNLLYWNWLVRMAADAVVPDGGESSKQGVEQNVDDQYGKTVEGMMGFQYGDVDPREPISEVHVAKEVANDALPVNDYLTSMLAKKGRKGRAPKVGDQMVIDKYGQPSPPVPGQPVTKGKKKRAPKVGDKMVIDKF